MMLAMPLILSLILAGTAPVDDLPRSSVGARDLEKFGKDIEAAFEALEAEAVTAEQKALDAITTQLEKLAKKLKTAAPLTYVGDWNLAFELAKPDEREIKSQIGKGFFRYTFIDDANTKDEDDDLLSGCLLSIPAGYTKAEELLPVIVALKPVFGLSGSELDAKVKAMAEAMYASQLETHIILVPLGDDVRAGRGYAAREVEGSWLADGLSTYFTSFRVLLERVRFDRARVVLDGWGEAGLDAMRMATSFPSWFAGVINRSGEPGDELVLYGNLAQVPVLYVNGATEGREVDTAALAARADAVSEITVLEEAGSALAPSTETQTAVAEWIAGRRRDLAPSAIDYKLGDVRFQSVDWLKAVDPRVRAGARPGDNDYPHLVGRIDRATNTIHLDTVNVLEVSVYLSDALVDLDKPVRLLVNGVERLNRVYRRELRTMIENRFFVDDGYCGVYTVKLTVGEIPPNIPEKSP